MNFAVVGSTALDAAFLEEMGVYNDITNNSLRIQLDWFQEMLSFLCNTSSGQLPICLLIFSFLFYFIFLLESVTCLAPKRHCFLSPFACVVGGQCHINNNFNI